MISRDTAEIRNDFAFPIHSAPFSTYLLPCVLIALASGTCQDTSWQTTGVSHDLRAAAWTDFAPFRYGVVIRAYQMPRI